MIYKCEQCGRGYKYNGDIGDSRKWCGPFCQGASQGEKEVKAQQAAIDRLNCNNVACHQCRDILSSIYEAMAQLPCNGVQGILCGTAQEIAALRDDVKRLKDRLVWISDYAVGNIEYGEWKDIYNATQSALDGKPISEIKESAP